MQNNPCGSVGMFANPATAACGGEPDTWKQPKANAMPSDHGLWFDDNDSVQAARPYTVEQDPEGPIQSG